MLRPLVHVLLGSLIFSSTARADSVDVPTVKLAGTVPFSADELRQALDLRPPPGGWAEYLVDSIVVAEGGDDSVVASIGTRELSVEFNGAKGMAAARLLALALVEFVGAANADVGSDAELTGVASVSAEESEAFSSTNVEKPLPASRAPAAKRDGASSVKLTVNALGTVGRGFGSLEPLSASLGAGLTGDWDPLLVAASIEGYLIPANEREGLRTSVRGLRVRAQSGANLKVVQLLLGPAFMPLWVSGGKRLFSSWVFALGFAARVLLPLSKRTSVLLLAGADYYLRRFEFTWQDRSVLATPRMALTLGVGISWRAQ